MVARILYFAMVIGIGWGWYQFYEAMDPLLRSTFLVSTILIVLACARFGYVLFFKRRENCR